jgi:hypothetical protein
MGRADDDHAIVHRNRCAELVTCYTVARDDPLRLSPTCRAASEYVCRTSIAVLTVRADDNHVAAHCDIASKLASHVATAGL